MKLDIETWTSDKGNSEVHHFIAGTQTYVFGVNRELLGEQFYKNMRTYAESELKMMDLKSKL